MHPLAARRLAADIVDRGADEAVANNEMVIQERERLVGRKGREPDGQPRQLDGHGIDVDAEETPLRDFPAQRRPFSRRDLPGCHWPSRMRLCSAASAR